MSTAEEDRLLRLWTPRILRGALFASMGLLVAGLLGDLLHRPGHALLVAGLVVLTLVPIGRVAFTAIVFLRERDWLFSAITALVLALLCAGVLLGRMG